MPESSETILQAAGRVLSLWDVYQKALQDYRNVMDTESPTPRKATKEECAAIDVLTPAQQAWDEVQDEAMDLLRTYCCRSRLFPYEVTLVPDAPSNGLFRTLADAEEYVDLRRMAEADADNINLHPWKPVTKKEDCFPQATIHEELPDGLGVLHHD